VDADHIAAIDNVTRKLMQQKKRPLAVGLFFSLGHSSLVVLASVGVVWMSEAVNTRLAQYRDLGELLGTSISALFLFAIALMNLWVLRSVYGSWKRVRAGEPYQDEDFDLLLADRGFLARLFRPLFKFITQSWHMFPLGFLFALGFDTATEVILLGLSANQAVQGLSALNILVFPLLFSAGMSLVDTLEGHLMLNAYGWAYQKPMRKIYYNLVITALSVLVAVGVGSIEALGLVADRLDPQGGWFWEGVAMLNHHFGVIGYAIVGLFLVSWAFSAWLYRWRRWDESEFSS
jgi:high-affinity nickel-transport protein